MALITLKGESSTDLCIGAAITPCLISHITDDKPWQVTNPFSKYVKFSTVCHALFSPKMHFNDCINVSSSYHSFIHLLMMWCIKLGLFVTLCVYQGFFLDIFLHSLKIWSRSYQLTQPVLLIHKLFLFLQWFFWLLPIVPSYNGEKNTAETIELENNSIFCI